MRTKCIDLAELINRYAEEDYVVVKLDVEGSEYNILPHLLKKGAFNKIDAIGVEYHEYLAPKNQTYSIRVFDQISKVFGIRNFAWS